MAVILALALQVATVYGLTRPYGHPWRNVLIGTGLIGAALVLVAAGSVDP